jgi:hypothetical protein
METRHWLRANLKVFVSHAERGQTTKGCLMSYQLSPDATYQAIELFLYVMSFFAAVLIFLYIASERPPDKTGKKEEKENE